MAQTLGSSPYAIAEHLKPSKCCEWRTVPPSASHMRCNNRKFTCGARGRRNGARPSRARSVSSSPPSKYERFSLGSFEIFDPSSPHFENYDLISVQQATDHFFSMVKKRYPFTKRHKQAPKKEKQEGPGTDRNMPPSAKQHKTPRQQSRSVCEERSQERGRQQQQQQKSSSGSSREERIIQRRRHSPTGYPSTTTTHDAVAPAVAKPPQLLPPCRQVLTTSAAKTSGGAINSSPCRRKTRGLRGVDLSCPRVRYPERTCGLRRKEGGIEHLLFLKKKTAFISSDTSACHGAPACIVRVNMSTFELWTTSGRH